ncbi:Na+/H+ antiporter subunit E [Pontibacter roseus]|uniref:Na+/H+ antiporter subunit E n=1 Tax=Pontibacter roseus TaxID=336989 RepID=UPI00035F536A|nr:Na+/H+ antiporter subunit E [Pontibacter roseus]
MKTFLLHSISAFVLSYLFFKYLDSGVPYNALTAVAVATSVLFMLWLSSLAYNRTYFRKLPKALNFLLYFLKELIVANLRVAYDILTPRYHMQPIVIALPLTVKTDLEITLLTGFITLTPGSLTIDLSSDRKFLYMHSLYLKNGDVEELKRSIKEGFERRLLELTR